MAHESLMPWEKLAFMHSWHMWGLPPGTTGASQLGLFLSEEGSCFAEVVASRAS